MAKVLCVLYPDPIDGYPPVYAREGIPTLRGYPGRRAPTRSSTVSSRTPTSSSPSHSGRPI